MHIGFLTDGLADYTLDDVLETCRSLGITGVELGTGNWSAAKHLDINALLNNPTAIAEYKKKFEDYGISIDAFNCSGNVLHPVDGAQQLELVKKTFRLAQQMGVRTIVTTSGLPGGCAEDRCPNWVTTHWPPENYDMLDYQWNTVAIPAWKELVKEARACGVRVAFELHPTCLVYNLYTYERLVDGVGDCRDVLGINMDPSHMMWMGGDGREIVKTVPEVIYHVHLKDVVFHDQPCAVNGTLDNKPGVNMAARSWSFDVPGKGRDEAWWSEFLRDLSDAGYNGILSVELEDYSGKPKNPLAEAAKFMKPLVADYPDK